MTTHCYDEICLRAQAGDAAAMDRIIRIMVKITSKYLSNLPIRFRAGYEIRDLIQTAMIGVLEGIRKYDPSVGVPAKSWLLMIAQRKINTELRDQNRGKRRINLFAVSLSAEIDRESDEPRTLQDFIEDSRVNVQAEVDGAITAVELLEKLKPQLTVLEASILQLLYVGYSGPAITEKLGVNYKSIDNAQQRIRRKARKLLGGVS
jgi:RNA polymerase sporulation-specific sigma factor